VGLAEGEKPLPIALAVDVLEEDRGPIVPAGEDVVAGVIDEQAWGTWHRLIRTGTYFLA